MYLLVKTNAIMTPAAVVIALLFSVVQSHAGTSVSGRFGSTSGQELVLSIAVNTTTPANLIVEQYISGNAKVVSTSPSAKKIEGGGATVKWLLRNITTGTVSLRSRLNEPISGGVSAIVRYRDPATGAFTEIRISP